MVGYDRPRLDELLRRAARPRLGAAVADATTVAAQGRCSVTEGAYVGRVSAGGVAQRAGLQVGDVIIALGGQAVGGAQQLEQWVAAVRPGQALPAVFVRDGQQQTITLRF
ncbi:MAG: PDZ domain-containing protein [Chloroflexota bacterium]